VVLHLFRLDESEIESKVQDRSVRICVFGLGRMGLPLACAFADAGFKVVGIDVDAKVVEKVVLGETWFDEPGLDELLARVVKTRRLTATLDAADAVRKCDFIVCMVPLGLDERKRPDFSIIKQVARTISENLRKGHVISFGTTLPLGTTENLLKLILEESGLEAGKDFGLVYAPERLMAGHVLSRLKELKKIVGGVDKKSSFIASEIYKIVYPSGTSVVENPQTAEMIKLAAGLWRDVNIAFANEMAKIADEYNVDIVDVVDEVNTSPRRIMLKPGCGVGGHCIPVYPYFLINSVKSSIPLINAARKTNESMPEYAVKLAEEGLKKKGKDIEGSRIAILGLAFRPYVKQVANSPTLELVRILKDRGAIVFVFDPLFEKREVEKITGVRSGDFDNILGDADCVIVSTMYRMFEKIKEKVRPDCVIIDGRNRLEKADKGIGR
jgi:nucleotide sugar dehydrogenase